MYKIKKRAITLLILTTLLLSIFTIMPVSAVDVTDVDPDWERYGEEIEVSGPDGDVPAGYEIEAYWDDVTQDWDGEKGKIASDTADADGGWSIEFDVPEADWGTHYIWVKVPANGDTDSIAFDVRALVDNAASSGLGGEDVDLDMYGFSSDADIAIFLVDDPDPAMWDMKAPTIGEASITSDGTEEELDDNVDNDDVIVNGTVTLYIAAVAAYTDDGHGDLDPTGPAYPGDGTFNYITGAWTLDGDGDNVPAGAITFDYTEFDEVADSTYILDTHDTNTVGSLTGHSVELPSAPDPIYGGYWIAGYDQNARHGVDTFTVGAVVEISDDTVSTGQIVKLEGRGFNPNTNIASIDLWLDDTPDVWVNNVEMETVKGVDNDGEFAVNVYIPESFDDDLPNDDYYIEVTDDGGVPRAAAVDLEILESAEIEVDPDYGPQGSRIAIEGSNFPNDKGEDIVVELWDEEPDYYAGPAVQAWVADMDEFETSSDGTWSGTVRVPTQPDDEYWIVAYWDDGADDYTILAYTEFRVGTILVLLSDDEGPTGMEVALTGSGFSENEEWNATFGDMDLFTTDDVTANGLLEFDGGTPEFFVPQVDPGTYDIVVLDLDSDIQVVVEFTVTATTEASVTPAEAPRKYNMTFEGMYWPEDNRVLEFTLFNETDEWDITGQVGTGNDAGDPDAPVTSSNADDVLGDGEDGEWVGWWKIDQSDELDMGDYWVNITDVDEDYFVQVMFTVGPVHEVISPRKSTFRIGEIVSFNIEHSYGNQAGEDILGGVVNVYDPTGMLYWAGDALNTWTDVELWWVVPLSHQTSSGNQMLLLDDAPLGEWSFEWLDGTVDQDEVATGTFSVAPSEADVLSGKIDDLAAQVTDTQDQLTGVSDKFAELEDAIKDAQAAGEAAEKTAREAVDAVNAIAETANSAAEAAQDAAAAAEDAKAASSGLTTLVYGAIGASLVAALAAIVSLMQISRRIAG
jgi:hypothetical protein